MAVETRYIVIRTNRNQEEVEVKTFADKRSADDYDKMLDVADGLFDVILASPLQLSEHDAEELSFYLAQSKDAVLAAMQSTKVPKAKKKPAKASQQQSLLNDADAKIEDDKKASIQELNVKDDKLVDFIIEKDDAA